LNMRRQIELQNSARAPIRKTMRGAVERLLIFLWGGSPKQYWPETHYMRGRGPKWLEKHGGELKEDSNLVKILNATNEKWTA
jgi:hypothetical protein